MTDFGAFTATLKEWANRGDWSDDLVTSFVRSAEEKLNSELRIDRMIKTEDAIIVSCCAPLPDDWLQMDFTRLEDEDSTNFFPIEYKPREEYFLNLAPCTYTLEGRQIFIGGLPDSINGRTVRIDYYAEVPVFSDTISSWVYTKFPSLYRCAALMHADLHAVGEENAAGAMKQLAEDMIQKLNDDHRLARASGSRLSRSRVRSFG
jgi:hypothetical protein